MRVGGTGRLDLPTAHIQLEELVPNMAYFGPEFVMPLASAAAVVAGVALMFWNRTVAFFKAAAKTIGTIFRPSRSASPTEAGGSDTGVAAKGGARSGGRRGRKRRR